MKVGAGERWSFVLHPIRESGSFVPTGDALCPLDVLEGRQANIRPNSARTAEQSCPPPGCVCLSFSLGKAPGPRLWGQQR